MDKTLAVDDLGDVAAWYGKVASLGDFVQRRVPPECLQRLDAWLSSVMRDAREQLGIRRPNHQRLSMTSGAHAKRSSGAVR